MFFCCFMTSFFVLQYWYNYLLVVWFWGVNTLTSFFVGLFIIICVRGSIVVHMVIDTHWHCKLEKCILTVTMYHTCIHTHIDKSLSHCNISYIVITTSSTATFRVFYTCTMNYLNSIDINPVDTNPIEQTCNENSYTLLDTLRWYIYYGTKRFYSRDFYFREVTKVWTLWNLELKCKAYWTASFECLTSRLCNTEPLSKNLQTRKLPNFSYATESIIKSVSEIARICTK